MTNKIDRSSLLYDIGEDIVEQVEQTFHNIRENNSDTIMRLHQILDNIDDSLVLSECKTKDDINMTLDNMLYVVPILDAVRKEVLQNIRQTIKSYKENKL